MNDDALAAVIAAAHALLARGANERAPAPESAWKISARMPIQDAAHARLVSRLRSRWALSGRLRD